MPRYYNSLRAVIVNKKPLKQYGTHCTIRREYLASKHLSYELKEVLTTAITVINYIKACPQKAIFFFSKMCSDIGAEHIFLLYVYISHWLSHSNAISHVFELRKELHSFLVEENHT